MIKFLETKVVFQEVPDEITLAINITNCTCFCEGCHSDYLSLDIGEYLTKEKLSSLINLNQGITCISFMGGDSAVEDINELAFFLRWTTSLKIAWYSGRDILSKRIYLGNFDFIKLGHFEKSLGPLTSKSTNQKFFEVKNNGLIDITYKFWDKRL